jgi:hypothetical protein
VPFWLSHPGPGGGTRRRVGAQGGGEKAEMADADAPPPPAPQEPPALPPAPAPAASKYDFVKVRVHLPGGQSYILSRFLVARMLTAAAAVRKKSSRTTTAAPSPVAGAAGSAAVRAALALKKRLVDAGRLDVTQAELQAELSAALDEEEEGEGGRGAPSVPATSPTPAPTTLAALQPRDRFAAVSHLFAARSPLLVLLCTPPLPGGPGAGLGRALAAPLNLPPAVQADLLLTAAVVPAVRAEGDEEGEEGESGGSGVVSATTTLPWWARPGPLAPRFLAAGATLAAALGPDLARGWERAMGEGRGQGARAGGQRSTPCFFLQAVGGGTAAAKGAAAHPAPIILPVLVRVTVADTSLLAEEACERDPVRWFFAFFIFSFFGAVPPPSPRNTPLSHTHTHANNTRTLSLTGPGGRQWRTRRPGGPPGRAASICRAADAGAGAPTTTPSLLGGGDGGKEGEDEGTRGVSPAAALDGLHALILERIVGCAGGGGVNF